MALEVKGKVSLDGSGFNRTLSGLGKEAKSWAVGLKGHLAGLFTVGAVTAYARAIVQNAASIKDMAEQTDLTTEAVQRLQIAGGKVGVEFGTVQSALAKLGQARKSAGEGNADMAASLSKFGVSVEDVNNASMSTYDLLQKVTQTVGGAAMNAADKAALSDLFGIKNADKVLAVLRELQNLGPVQIISDDEIARLDAIDKKFEELKRKALAFGTEVAVSVAAALEKGPGRERAKGVLKTADYSPEIGSETFRTLLEDLRTAIEFPTSGISLEDATKAVEEYVATASKLRAEGKIGDVKSRPMGFTTQYFPRSEAELVAIRKEIADKALAEREANPPPPPSADGGPLFTNKVEEKKRLEGMASVQKHNEDLAALGMKNEESRRSLLAKEEQIALTRKDINQALIEAEMIPNPQEAMAAVERAMTLGGRLDTLTKEDRTQEKRPDVDSLTKLGMVIGRGSDWQQKQTKVLENIEKSLDTYHTRIEGVIQKLMSEGL